jgi:hypothetical protein
MSNKDRLGYYQVGWKKFYHKTLALIEHTKTRQKIEWIFNDIEYGSIDWTIPVVESLDDLYKRRAQQLRDNYDYLALYFSGGADSSNMLRAFLNNGIFLDEIVMQSPEPVRKTFNDIDKSDANVYSEIPYSAVPILNELKNLIHPNTIIRYQDTSQGLIELFNYEDWFEDNPFGVTLALNPLARQHTSFTEKHILKLCDTGKRIAQIIGTDKPLIMYDGKDYYSYFLDVTALHVPPVDLTKREISDKAYHTEFFYWTPDMPEIAVKQAQEVKRYCELDSMLRTAVCSINTHIGDLRSILHPIIYPSMPEPPFQVEKSRHEAVRKKDNWFWDNATSLQKFNYQGTINHLKNNIDSVNFTNGDINKGLIGQRSKLYKL